MLRQPVAAGSKALLVCFSHLRWDFVYQRPQHLISRAAQSHRVIFMEEPIYGPQPDHHLELQDQPNGITIAVPGLVAGTPEAEAIDVQRRFLDTILTASGPVPGGKLVLWYYTPMALAFSGHLSAGLTIYDCMDELSAFKGAPPGLLDFEQQLFERADLVFTGGHSLYRAKRRRHPHMHVFPSSIDKTHFMKARRRSQRQPEDQAAIAYPRIGFFGVIDERMDLDLVQDLARSRPDWQFVMIGPVVKIDPASLPRQANIHWLGRKSYAELPCYLAGWDLGFMPFALNESTRFISPTKTPEFLAAGLPVVSTPIADVVQPYGDRGLVEIAATAEDCVAKAEKLLVRRPRRWLTAVDAYLADQSWDRTWSAMQRLMEDALPESFAVAADQATEDEHV